MKVTKRTILSSVRSNPAYQRIMADKQELRIQCAALTINEKEGTSAVSIRQQ